MVELVRHYCEVCEKEGIHLFKTYYDGTVVQICLACRHSELNKLGYDFNRIKKAVEDETIINSLFPPTKRTI